VQFLGSGGPLLNREHIFYKKTPVFKGVVLDQFNTPWVNARAEVF
jgi:hypothetical protein